MNSFVINSKLKILLDSLSSMSYLCCCFFFFSYSCSLTKMFDNCLLIVMIDWCSLYMQPRGRGGGALPMFGYMGATEGLKY